MLGFLFVIIYLLGTTFTVVDELLVVMEEIGCGFDGVGFGCRLMNHDNLVQYLSFYAHKRTVFRVYYLSFINYVLHTLHRLAIE